MKNNNSNIQYNLFIDIIKKNSKLMEILDYLSNLKLPNFYITAGCIYQTVCNYLANEPLDMNIHDIDILYYNENESNDERISLVKQIENHFLSLGYKYEFDLYNEAKYHLK